MQRITNSLMVSNLIQALNERMRNLSGLQNQLTTGKRVLMASDDPVAAGLILELRNRIRQNEQFQENASNAVGWLTATESVLQQMNDLMIQARADAVEGGNASLTPEDLMALAENVNGYLENLFSLANTDYMGKSLFGGTNTKSSAFEVTRDPATGWITAITPNPDGVSGQILRQIGNETMQINISGTDLFQPNGAGADQDIFQILISLRDALAAGDPELVGQSLDPIDEALANISDFTSLVGSQVNRLTSLQDVLLLQKTNLTDQLSREEDADLVEVMTQMTLEQNAYQAALNVGAMIIQPSLANFI